MATWNIIDIIIIIILSIGVLTGYQRGLIHQVIHLTGFIAAFILSFYFYKDFANILSTWLPFPDISDQAFFSFVTEMLQLQNMFYSALSFGILFFLSKWMISSLGHMLHLIVRLPVLNTINKAVGAIVGLITTILILLIIVNILYVMPSIKIHEKIREAKVAMFFIEQTPFVTDYLQQLWKEDFIYLSRPQENKDLNV